MTTERRVAAVEAALSPRELVVRWVLEVQEYPTLEDYARSTLDLPDDESPLSRIARSAERGARAAMKGRARDDVEAAVRRAVGDALFLFCLVMEINQVAVELSRLHGLRAAAITFWMGALLGGPRRKRGQPIPPDEAAAWRKWFATLDALLGEVGIEVEAWQSLEERYLAGHRCLFEDAATEWAKLEVQLDYLERIAEPLRTGLPSDVAGEPREDGSRPDEPTEAGTARARFLADSARVKAFELLGERWRAVKIMERRLRPLGPTP